VASTPSLGPKIVTTATRQIPILGWTVAGPDWRRPGVQPVSTTLELAMRMITFLAAFALLSATQAFAAASSTRIAEAGAYLLGNAHRCGVADDRVVRAGKVIRDLIAAAADDESERKVAKSRFAEIFRASAEAEGSGRTLTPPCKTVVMQFERLEHFHEQTGTR
jgi:hypothetical protein